MRWCRRPLGSAGISSALWLDFRCGDSLYIMQASFDPSVRPLYASGFYPQDPRRCEEQIESLLANTPSKSPPLGSLLGGLVPHAGWVYSGATALRLWRTFAEQSLPPELIVLLGAVHRPGVGCATLSAEDRWATPLGTLGVDARLRSSLIEGSEMELLCDNQAHVGEHSIEVQLPFIRYLLPEVSILPIQVPADSRADALGLLLARAIASDGRNIAVVASSDLTHYGSRYGFLPAGSGKEAVDFGRRNDQLLLDQVHQLSPQGVLREAREHHNACGSGALAAAISCSRALGADQVTLLHHTTSNESGPQVDPEPSMFVGYAAMLLGRA